MTPQEKFIEDINKAVAKKIGNKVIRGKVSRDTFFALKENAEYATQQFPEGFLSDVTDILKEFGLSGWQSHNNHGMMLLKFTAGQIAAAVESRSGGDALPNLDTSPQGLLNAVTVHAWPANAGAPPEWYVDADGDHRLDFDPGVFGNDKSERERFARTICPNQVTGGKVMTGEDYIVLLPEYLENYWRKGRFSDGSWRPVKAPEPLAMLLEKEDWQAVKPVMSPLEKLAWVTRAEWTTKGGGYELKNPEYMVDGILHQFFPEINYIEPLTTGDEGKEKIWLPADYVAKWCSGEFAGVPERLRDLNKMIEEANRAVGKASAAKR